MADFTQLQGRYRSGTTDKDAMPAKEIAGAVYDATKPDLAEDKTYPGGYTRLTDEEKQLRDIWDYKTPEERAVLIEKYPHLEQALLVAYEPRVIEEMPDELADSRNFVKQFAHVSNDKEKIAFLKNRHPDYSFEMYGDRIFARGKDSEDYYSLDPDTGFLSATPTEMGRDIKDVGRDIMRGAAEGGYAILGSVGGLMGAGAVSGMGAGTINYADQQKAIDLGLRQRPPSIDEAAKEGSIATAFTLAFGTGRPRPGQGKLQEAGLISRGASEAGKKVAPTMTGSPAEYIDIASKNMDEFREITKKTVNSPDGGATVIMDKFGKPARDAATEKYFALQKKEGAELAKVAESITEVDMSEAYKVADNYAEDLLHQWHMASDDQEKKTISKVVGELRERFFSSVPVKRKLSKEAKETIRDWTMTYRDLDFGEAFDEEKLLKTMQGELLQDKKFLKSLQRGYKDAQKTGDVGRLRGLESELESVEAGVNSLGAQIEYLKSQLKQPLLGHGDHIVTNTPDEFQALKQLLLETGNYDPKMIYTAKEQMMTGKAANKLRRDLAKLARLSERSKQPDVLAKYSVDEIERLKGLGKSAEKISDLIEGQAEKLLLNKDAAAKAGQVDVQFLEKGFKDKLNDYKEVKKTFSVLKPILGDKQNPQKAFNLIRNLYKESNASQIAELYKVAPEVLALAKKYEAYKLFGKRFGQSGGIVKEAERPTAHHAIAKLLGIGGGIGVGAVISALGGPLGQVLSWPIGGAIGAGLLATTSPKALRTAADLRDYIGKGKIGALPSARTLYEHSRQREQRKRNKEK